MCWPASCTMQSRPASTAVPMLACLHASAEYSAICLTDCASDRGAHASPPARVFPIDAIAEQNEAGAGPTLARSLCSACRIFNGAIELPQQQQRESSTCLHHIGSRGSQATLPDGYAARVTG